MTEIKKNTLESPSAPNPVSIFVYGNMDKPGGIQSIVSRQLKLAKREGQTAFVICKENCSIPDVCSERRLDVHEDPKKLIEEIRLQQPDSDLDLKIIAFSPEAAPIGFLLQVEALSCPYVKNASFSLTILHPRDLMRETEKSHVHLMNKLLAHAIGLSNLVFMNDCCRKTHSDFLSCDLSKNRIVPVPIDQRLPRWTGSSDADPIRIVSIGRIVSFKAYNFALPKIVAEFAREGRSVTCDIFGYGREKDRLINLVNLYDVSNLLKVHDAIPLEMFDEVVSKYDLFIGMGTAALQAAQLGVPTILAIVDDECGAHGFMHSAPFGNLGESDASIPRRDLKEVIDNYARTNLDERKRISREGVDFANLYVSESYIHDLTWRSEPPGKVSRRIAGLYCKFYRWMGNDNWLRGFFRLLKRHRESGNTL